MYDKNILRGVLARCSPRRPGSLAYPLAVWVEQKREVGVMEEDAAADAVDVAFGGRAFRAERRRREDAEAAEWRRKLA